MRPLGWCLRSIWLDHENSEPALRHQHNLHVTVEIPGRLSDIDHKALILWLVAKHETFRTRIYCPLDVPAFQNTRKIDLKVLSDLIQCTSVDLTGPHTGRSADALAALIALPFDLEHDLLLRSLLLVSDTQSELNLVMHHITNDRASVQLLRAEIEDWAANRGSLPTDSDDASQVQYVYEQSDGQAAVLAARARAHWRAELAWCSPTNFPNRPVFGGSPGLVEVVLGSVDLGTAATTLARRLHTTTSGVYLGAFALTLATVTHSPTISVKALWSNRVARWQRSLLASRFLPTLVVLNTPSPSLLSDTCRSAGKVLLRAGQFGYAPYDEFLEEVVHASVSRNMPIALGTVFNFLPASVRQLSGHPDGMTVSSSPVSYSAEQCNFTVSHSPGGARLKFTAQRDVMSEATCKLIVQTVAQLISSASENDVRETLTHLQNITSEGGLAPGSGWTLVGPMWVDTRAIAARLAAVDGVRSVKLDDAALKNRELVFTVVGDARVTRPGLVSALRSDMYHFVGVRPPDRIDLVNIASDGLGNPPDTARPIPAEFSNRVEDMCPGSFDDGASWCEAGGRYLDIPRLRRLAANYGVSLPAVHEIGSAVAFASLLTGRAQPLSATVER